MRKMPTMLCWLGFLMAALVDAQTPTCDRLTGGQRALAEELLSTQHPYDCCDLTILECLRQDPICSLTFRLSENICRRVIERQEKDKIIRSLSRRARSMLPEGARARIDLDGVPVLGEESAPVLLVEYACARCPYCSKLTPKLVGAIVKGPLQGKVKLYFKVFPIRGHPDSKEAGLAFLAAAKMGRFWEYALVAYERFGSFDVNQQLEWARAAGMDRVAFEGQLTDLGTRRRLVASKKEGVVNKVEVTPTFFINGRKYFGDLDLEEIVDVLEEEYEQVKGIERRRQKKSG